MNNKTILSSFILFLVLICLTLSMISSTELDSTINAQLSDFDTDFYFQTASDALAGYDYLDSLLLSFPNGNYSFLYSNIVSKNLTNDAWPASNRTLNLVYRVNPSTSGTLALTWDSSTFGFNYTVSLIDYGSDSSYTTAITSVNMKTSSSYSVSFSGTLRYFIMNVTYVPVYCGDGARNGNEACDSSDLGGASCTSQGFDSGTLSCSASCSLVTSACSSDGGGSGVTTCTPNCGDTSTHCVGTTYSNGCSGGENACTGTLAADCGTRTCGTSPNSCGSCGSCSSGNCVDGTCVACVPSCPLSSLTACGQSLGSNGCGGTCSGFGSFCSSGTGICDGTSCIPCTESWSCSGFGNCVNGIQTQTCVDANSCGTIVNRPSTTQICTVPTCISNADCISSNPCSTGTCNSVSGTCIYVNNQNSCDDNNGCTINDVCSYGSCAGFAKVCDLGYTCSSGACVEGQKPDEKDIPENLVRLGNAKIDCTADFICGDFSSCSASYDISNLITGSEASGFKTRVCFDKNKCLIDFTDTQTCNIKQDVTVMNKIWCGQNYTEIIDSAGEVVARVRKSLDNKFVNVDFNAAGDAYCSYCYDSIKNYDETEIDCGGSCMTCSEKNVVVTKPFYQTDIFKLGLSLGSFLIFLVLFLTLTSAFITAITADTSFQLFLKKYARWKNAGYDVDVLSNEINIFKGKN